MHTLRLLLPVLAAVALSACATDDPARAPTASNPVTGHTRTTTSGATAIAAYGALGTSDDVRGRSGSPGASVLTGRANLSGGDSGTPRGGSATTNSGDDTPPPPPR